MGRPMAEHLIKAGHHLRLASRSGVPAGMVEGDVVECASAAEASIDVDVIITTVPDTADVDAVLLGPAGVIETAKAGSIVVDMGSISPLASKQFAARLGERGIGCLDAPVSGGEVGAKAGSLTIMVGGPTDLFERVKPLFGLMGRNIHRVGDHGAGQTTKVANQIIVALTIEAVSEALVLASRAGADPVRVREALLGGFANSRVLEVHGERMIKRNFAPGFRVELHQKDLNLALENAPCDSSGPLALQRMRGAWRSARRPLLHGSRARTARSPRDRTILRRGCRRVTRARPDDRQTRRSRRTNEAR